MDDTFQIYVNRAARLTLPEALRSQVQHIQPSPKFRRHPDGSVEPASFPGYSVITPPWVEETENNACYEQLQAFQQKILQQLPENLVVAVPPESFHFTLADLIWDGAFRHAAEADPAFETKLRDRIDYIFHEFEPALRIGKPAYWQILGIAVRTRAVGVCLAPKDEASYEQVLQLRRAIYQDLGLIALGIEQQYHLTAHITLGYFNDVAEDLNRDSLSETLSALNLHWLESSQPQSLWVHRAELRKFDNMTRYYREPEWAAVEF